MQQSTYIHARAETQSRENNTDTFLQSMHSALQRLPRRDVEVLYDSSVCSCV